MNWYRKAINSALDDAWTQEELDFLYEACQNLDRYSSRKTSVEYSIGTTTAILKVDAIREPDASYGKKLYIEKQGTNLYEVSENEGSFRTVEKFEVIKDIISDFIRTI